MRTLKEIREAKAEVAGRLKKLHEEMTREKKPEHDEQWRAATAEFTKLEAEETRAKELLRIGSSPDLDLDEPINPARRDRGAQPQDGDVITRRELERVFAAWASPNSRMRLTERDREVCREIRFDPSSSEIEIRLSPQLELEAIGHDFRQHGGPTAYRNLVDRLTRAQGTTSDAAGGATIPSTLIANLEVALLEYGGIRAAADIMRTATGEPLTWPGVNDTGNKGAIVAEGVDVGDQDIAFSKTIWNAYKYSSKAVTVPWELFEDTAVDLTSYIGRALGERIGRAQSEHFTVGTGSGQPTGIVPAATSFGAAAAGAIALDDLLGLQHAVDPAYRTGAQYMCHDSIILAVRTLKDTQGRYLWEPDLQAGGAGRILGYPILVNQDMVAAPAATTKRTVLFGSLKAYKIREVASVRFRRLDELAARTDQVVFFAFARADGNLLNAGTNPVKALLH